MSREKKTLIFPGHIYYNYRNQMKYCLKYYFIGEKKGKYIIWEMGAENLAFLALEDFAHLQISKNKS